MERMVFEVALKGDVESLKRLLDEDPLALERSMASVYSDTPLHVAAMLGYQDFANEILRRKPQLAKELNSNQSSPLHLAAAMGHAGVVRCLLLADRGMCKTRDRDGLTPFHLAAVKGRVEVLKELMMSDGHEICSRELSEVMGMDGEMLGESILHMCVKHGQLEALKFLVEIIGDSTDFVNSKDALGNTILHLAVEYKQFEPVKFLVQRSRIQVKAKNGNGLTAMDTLFHTRNNNINVKEMEIGEALVVKRDNYFKESENWVNEMRGGLMVAASLLATMAFQAVVSPPGGIIGDDDKPIKYAINCIFFGFLYGKEDLCSYENLNDIEYKPIVGTSVMSYYQPAPYTVFMVANTLSFLASPFCIAVNDSMVAAMLGYEDFANEILRRKPELAKELNSKQSSPLHLAAAMGHAGVVRALLLVDRGMLKGRDRDGLTPFHLAAVKGRVEVLKELMSDDDGEICSSELLSDEVMGMDGEKLGENILQMCVKYGQLEALKLLVEMIADRDGEAVKFLVQPSRIQVNGENNGKEMEVIGEVVAARRENSKEEPEKYKKKKESWVNEMREGLMVVASLLATMTFQAIVSPPGGVMQVTEGINQTLVDDTVIFSSILDHKFVLFGNLDNNAPAPAPTSESMMTTGLMHCRYKPTLRQYHRQHYGDPARFLLDRSTYQPDFLPLTDLTYIPHVYKVINHSYT
nr:serine/threonine-protein phosphatase 6 regulatory ankyrin repeat subunit C-like [Ipomoea trifida]